jgi:hypothetical protein
MKARISSFGLFLLALALVAAANVVILSAVVYNRSGPPEAQVTLSERELQLPYRSHAENSGLSLRLTWRTLDEDGESHAWRSSPAWLTADKLKGLGFALPDATEVAEEGPYARTPLPRKVFVVLELDGPLYREAQERAAAALASARELYEMHPENEDLRKAFEAAQKQIERERLSASRLFAVDAGRDPGALRKRYEDRTRVIIAEGLVRVDYPYEDNRRRVRGFIGPLVIESIHVPRAHRRPLDAILENARAPMVEPAPPRYLVELVYGRRFEPWIVSVAPAPPQHLPENG